MERVVLSLKYAFSRKHIPANENTTYKNSHQARRRFWSRKIKIKIFLKTYIEKERCYYENPPPGWMLICPALIKAFMKKKITHPISPKYNKKPKSYCRIHR